MPEIKKEETTEQKTNKEKITIGIFFALMMGALAAADVFAFENGAVATISQGWLTINQKFWWLTYVLVVLCGILVQHVSVPRDPGHIVDQPAWIQALLWTPFFWLGLWITSKWLWQLPTAD